MPPPNGRPLPPAPGRAYPHVDGVVDWRAQQTIRLLWDQVMALDARLRAAEGAVGGLATTIDAIDSRLVLADHKADEALALAQLTKQQIDDKNLGAETDFGEGAKGFDAGGTSGDITGEPLTPFTAGKIVKGVSVEWASLRAPVASKPLRAGNVDELQDRLVWHLNQAGFPASRYPTDNGRPWLVLFDALSPDGEHPMRQYCYQVIDYSALPPSSGPVGTPPEWTVEFPMLMLFKAGNKEGVTTTPDAGIPD